ncbi:uncharacterized protein prob1 isoform X2 [Labrus bergylta]|uniref:uncharacterized protein prob1 isoform X2 n=1 Tax=Labrus bergylta TaxID=56723 RepID=UPI0033139FFB
MDRGGEKLIFLSSHRCPEVDALPHHDFVTHDPPPCSLVPAERSSRFTCTGDSETNYFDVSPSCGFDKEEDEEEERSVSDWSEEDLSLHFAPSVILRSDDEESDPESGFECIDVTMETLVQGQKGEGLKMVPKRQIQLKKKDVKPPNGSCEGGGAYCEMLCPPVRPDVLRRQHSMPASLQTSSDADSYRVCRGLAAGASQGIDGGGTSRLRLQKSFSLDETETKTKMASCIIKSILSKKMQVEKITCKGSAQQKKATVFTSLSQSADQQRVSDGGGRETSFPGGKTGAGVFKAPVHVVRDMRSLVKTTYGLSFSTTTPENHYKPTRVKVIGQEQSPPPTYQQVVGVGHNETKKSSQASVNSNSSRGRVAKVAASLSQSQDRHQSEYFSPPITQQRRGSEPVIRSKADDVTCPIVLLDQPTKPPVSRNLSELSQSERAKCGSHQAEASIPASLLIPPPPSMLLQQQETQTTPSSQEQSSILGLSSHFAPSSSQQILQPCFYPAQVLPVYSHTLQPQMGKVSYVSGPLSYIHLQHPQPAPTCHLLRRSEETRSPQNSPDYSEHFCPPQQPGSSVAQVSEGSTVTPTSQGKHDQQHAQQQLQQQLPQQKYLCNLNGVLHTQTGSDFMADITGSAAAPRALLSGYPHCHFMFDPRSGRCLLLDTPPTHQRKMLLDPETGQYVHVLIPKSSPTQNSSLVPMCSTNPTPIMLNPGPSLINPTPIMLNPGPSLINPTPTFMSMMHLQPTMAMSSFHSSPRLHFPSPTPHQ